MNFAFTDRKYDRGSSFVVKVTDTVVVSTNSSEAGQKTHAIAGLPLSLDRIYAFSWNSIMVALT